MVTNCTGSLVVSEVQRKKDDSGKPVTKAPHLSLVSATLHSVLGDLTGTETSCNAAVSQLAANWSTVSAKQPATPELPLRTARARSLPSTQRAPRAWQSWSRDKFYPTLLFF